jgi:hypothetical protein
LIAIERRVMVERLDCPWEVVVEARQREIRRCIGVVDRVCLSVLDDRFAGVEVPAKEGVDEAADRCHFVLERWGEEVVIGRVPVVMLLGHVVVHDPRLRADREAAREEVVVLDGRLEVHQPLT